MVFFALKKSTGAHWFDWSHGTKPHDKKPIVKGHAGPPGPPGIQGELSISFASNCVANFPMFYNKSTVWFYRPTRI